MSDTIYNLIIFCSTVLAVLVGYLFDVPPAILWAAAIGSGFGVAFSRPTTPIYAAGWVFTGTIFLGFAMPLVAHYWQAGLAAQKAAAFFIALLGIGFRHKVKDGVNGLIDKVFDRASKIIGGEK
jgi:hypothetical protein